MPVIKLTKSVIDKLPFAESGQLIYRDSELLGFGLRVGMKRKTFIAEKKINGSTTRVTLGGYPELPVEVARKMAQEALVKMITGTNPNQEKADNKVRTVTLEQVYEDFKKSRSHKPKTIITYDGDMRRAYGDWLHLQLPSITKNMIEDRHMKISIESGKASANRCGRMLRSILNFAIGKYELSNGNAVLSENPFNRLSRTKQWHRVGRKTGYLKPNQFPAFFRELDQVPNEVVADFIRFILFTGCRRSEAATLMWKHVNIPNRSFIIADPKNHNPIELPLTTYLMELILRRHSSKINDYVFPAYSKSGHIEEPKKTIANLGKSIDHPFCLHDLRRTYVTIAESLDVSQYAVKALVNHKMDRSDVTAGYVMMSVERLRAPMQQITDFILKSVSSNLSN
jgi:integrase